VSIATRFKDPVTVETYLGSGAYGDVFADPETRYGQVLGGTRLVRNAAGEEVVSQTTIHGPISDAPDDPPTAGQYAPGSQVTVNGRTARVIIAIRMAPAAAPSRIHHVVVHLT